MLSWLHNRAIADAGRDSVEHVKGDVSERPLRLTLRNAESTCVKTVLDVMEAHGIAFVEHPADVPTLCMRGRGTVFQPKTILRYVGRLTHTLPSRSAVDAALVDQYLELHTALVEGISVAMHPEKFGLELNGAARETQHAWLVKSHIPSYLARVNDELQSSKLERRSEWLAGMSTASIADVCWGVTFEWLRDGGIPGFDAAALAQFGHLSALAERVREYLDGASSESSEESEVGEPLPTSEYLESLEAEGVVASLSTETAARNVEDDNGSAGNEAPSSENARPRVHGAGLRRRNLALGVDAVSKVPGTQTEASLLPPADQHATGFT